MVNERQSTAPSEPVDDTLPQWQPPAGATRELPVVATEVAAQAAASAEPGVPSISGTRVGAQAQAFGLEHTLQAGPISIAPPNLLAVGDILVDRYVIEEHISSGGFGAVYRASDRQIRHHQVALKLLHLPAKDEQAQKAALRELTLIASVSHPSVVQFKDYGWYEGRLWFAMPWYRGETLAQRFSDSQGPLPMSREMARPIFERLARGLAAMHEVGIYHHDIKPENILVADIAGFDGGLPVLLDLGIASTRGEGPKGLTVEYAAPEVASAALGNRDKSIGGAADVFSLALVLRNLLEPETAPRTQGELLPLLHKRATERVPPPSKRELRYLKPVFERWLSLDPDERPSISELATEFAILTEPEERRENQKRLLRKIIPIVLVAAAAVALLVMQVRKQKTELTVQQKQLSQQMEQSEHLRRLSAEQLEQLEVKSEQIGEQGQQLHRAIAIARRLDNRLESTERRADGLTRKVRKLNEDNAELTATRDALARERDGLVAERDALTRTRERLTLERDELAAERDGLAAERDALTGERDALRRERDRIEAERNTVLAQRNEAIQKRDRLQLELADAQRRVLQSHADTEIMRKSLENARDELRALRNKASELEAARNRLEAANRVLEAQVNAFQRSAPAPATAAPAPAAGAGRVRLRTP